MKRILSIVFCLAFIMLFNACREEMKVTSVKLNGVTDSTIVTKIDGHEIVFSIKEATFDNGMVMAGDSVTVHYVGDMGQGTARALLIKLIPRKGHVVNAVYDPSKELKTDSLSDTDLKSMHEAIEFAKRHRK